MIFDTTTKSLLGSLLIHGLIIGGYFVYIYEEPLKVASNKKTISMDLQTVSLPKQNIEKPKPKPKPKKIEKPKPKPKPIKKSEPKHKPIIKEKPKSKKIEKPKPIKKVVPKKKQIKPTVKPKPIQPKKIKKPTKTKQVANKQAQQQAFRKTNFAIIRDMVLNNLEYPKIARRMGWQGIVKVKLVVDTNGKLTHYEIVQSANKKQLNKAALEAVESLLNRVLPKPKTQTTLILPISFLLQ